MWKRGWISLIRFYQVYISQLKGPTCRFYPTCSSYAMEAIQKYGALRGWMLAIRRILKCHPWHPGGVDFVPEPEEKTEKSEVKTLKK